MPKLTKLQIIDDTATHFNFGNRAANEFGGCHYCAPDGKKCAVGRYMGPDNKPGEYTGHVTRLMFGSCNMPLEEALIPEAREHNSLFWQDLQNLHDCAYNWSDYGLSLSGEVQLASMKERWG